MVQTTAILPFDNNNYLLGVGFVVLSLGLSLWHTDCIKDKKDLLFFIPLAAFLAASLHSVRIGIDLGTAFIISAIVYAFWKKRVYRPENYMWFLAAYFISMAISLLWSGNLIGGWHVLRRSLPFVTFSVAWSMFRLSRGQWERLLLVFFRASFLFIVISIGTSVYVSFAQGFEWWAFLEHGKHPVNGMDCYELVYAWTPYCHPSYNAYGLVIGLICGLCLFHRKCLYFTELLFYALSLLLLLAITQSRIGIVMYAVVLLIGLVPFIRVTGWRTVYVCAACAIAVVAAVGWVRINTVFSLDEARVHIFRVAVDCIRQHPVLGVGVGSLADTLQQDEICRYAQYGNPHNQILGDWMQGGLVSLAAQLAMMGCLIGYAVRYRNMEMLLFVAVSLLFMQIEMPLDIIKGLTTFVAFAHLFAHKPNERYNSRYDSM